jgi:hypothetical protein
LDEFLHDTLTDYRAQLELLESGGIEDTEARIPWLKREIANYEAAAAKARALAGFTREWQAQ